jgi:hypothetical protein
MKHHLKTGQTVTGSTFFFTFISSKTLRMNKKLPLLLCFLIFLTTHNLLPAQGLSFTYDPIPLNSGFKMEGYWVWGGSMVKVDGEYHLFASRWPKEAAFPDGYRSQSEIVRATSANPLGPFKFEEVVIGERDSSFWDANMAHNPTIHKIGDDYVLFYIGSDFTTQLPGTQALLRRVGYATAKSVSGPWERSPRPVISYESNNPALLVNGNRVLLLFRDEKLQTYMATADTYQGPFVVKNNNVWPDMKIEDFYLFRSAEGYHMICEDNVGGISGHVRWGVHLFSENGINNWLEYSPLIVYDHDLAVDNDSIIHCVRRERPQLLIEKNKITYLITSVFDGTDSWCQPVKLKHPVKLD